MFSIALLPSTLLSLISILLTTSRQSVLIRLIASHRQSSRRSEMLHYILFSCLILSSFFYVSLALPRLLYSCPLKYSHSLFSLSLSTSLFSLLNLSSARVSLFQFSTSFSHSLFHFFTLTVLDQFRFLQLYTHPHYTHPYPSIHTLTLKHQSLHLSGTVHGP